MRIEAQPRRAGDLRIAAPAAVPKTRRRRGLGLLCGFCGLAVALAPEPAAAQDQETVVIGGGPGQVTTDVYSPGGGGVTVNDEVLDSLGSGATPDLPYAPTPDMQGFVGQGLPPGTAYRMPGTGQLVVTRPSTLLFPPRKPPRSHLTMTPAPGALATVPESPGPTSGVVSTSQAMSPPAEPATTPAPSAATAPQPVVEEALATPAPTPAPQAKTQPAPEPMPEPETTVQAAPEPMASGEAPATPEVPPMPADVTAELQGKSGAAPTIPEPPAQPEAMEPPPEPATQPPPEPEVATQAEPPAAAETTQSAALPAAPNALGPERIDFDSGSADLSAEAKRTLDGIAAQMQSKKTIRAQLLAYAADSGDGTSQARRLSLSRALAVRAYLIDKGVRSTRLDVRALGSNVPDGPPDRVDIIPQSSG